MITEHPPGPDKLWSLVVAVCTDIVEPGFRQGVLASWEASTGEARADAVGRAVGTGSELHERQRMLDHNRVIAQRRQATHRQGGQDQVAARLARLAERRGGTAGDQPVGPVATPGPGGAR